MVYDVLIGVHAYSGRAQFIAGCLLLIPSLEIQTCHKYLFHLFLVFLALMLSPLLAVIAVDWPDLATAEHLISPALGVLAIYMAFRALQGSRVLTRSLPGWRLKFTEHVGFNLFHFLKVSLSLPL